MADVIKQKDGRNWSVDESGIKSLKRDYIVVMDSALTGDGEAISWTGVPAVGSAHPTYNGLYVESYDVKEGSNSAKRTLVVTVNYTAKTISSETEQEGEDPPVTIDYDVERWGWDAGTESKELVEGKDGTPVLNSAQDPFDRVPTYESPAPTFTKVCKTAARRGGVMDVNCKVNSDPVTIGGKTFPACTLLCQVAEERIIGDAVWKYRYTITLKYRTNKVKIEGGINETEIGWDAAITDTGMRAWDTTLGRKTLIKMMDWETGKMATVSSPTLLDGHGHAQQQGSEASTLQPYNFRFQAYERTGIPQWFVSEPT